MHENVWISIKISLKFVSMGPIINIPSLVQIMAWRRPGDKPLSEPMMVSLPTHLWITRSQWAKGRRRPRPYFNITKDILSYCKVLKVQDLCLKFSYHFEICQASQQYCCPDTCQISNRSEHFNTQSRRFKTLWDVAIRHLNEYWNGSLLSIYILVKSQPMIEDVTYISTVSSNGRRPYINITYVTSSLTG